MINLVGYLASVLLAISLLVSNDLKFRWLNTFGCLAFVVYGIMLGAFPIILTNSILLLINLFYLIKIYRTEEDFDLIEFEMGHGLVQKFITYHQTDLHAYFPSFSLDKTDNDICFIVLRDMVPANLFVANIRDGFAYVQLNYTVPKYRDYKVGKYIFDKEKAFLTSKGIKAVVYESVENKQHESFLKRMGFANQGSTSLWKFLQHHL